MTGKKVLDTERDKVVVTAVATIKFDVPFPLPFDNTIQQTIIDIITQNLRSVTFVDVKVDIASAAIEKGVE